MNTYYGYGVSGRAGTWLIQNAAIIPMAIAALAIETRMWAWYFWSVQGALGG